MNDIYAQTARILYSDRLTPERRRVASNAAVRYVSAIQNRPSYRTASARASSLLTNARTDAELQTAAAQANRIWNRIDNRQYAQTLMRNPGGNNFVSYAGAVRGAGGSGR